MFAAGLFLLHPAQTESVSYIASRSETLSVFFVLAAFVVFLYRRTAVLSVPRILCVLVLFAAASLSKEHTAVLPALLILTDYYWNFEFSPSLIWRNWKLYVPIAIGVRPCIGAASSPFCATTPPPDSTCATSRGLSISSPSAASSGITCACSFVPVGQNLDPDIQISRNIMDHGAVFASGRLADRQRARVDLPPALPARFVWMVRLADSAGAQRPPWCRIRDPMAERRMYLPFIGLLFVTLEFLRRWKVLAERPRYRARSGSDR